MFDQFFRDQATVARYHQSPFAAERQLYLSKLMEEGRSIETLRNIAWILIYVARHLPVHQSEITPTEIEAAAAAWAMTTHRSATCLHVGQREFVFHATNWMRLLGRLLEPEVKHPFVAETDAFLQFAVGERGLSPSTIRHYRVCVGEFLCWVEWQNKALVDVTLEDLSSYFRVLSQRGLKRTSVALHVAKLRNFLRFAESRHWCRSGLSVLDAPRIYRLESLPRGPAWSDVQKLLSSCAGDRPIEIRDHAMLLLIAVYGLRGGEVRYLRLEDIDWQREIIHIRRAKQRKSQSYPLVQEVGAAILHSDLRTRQGVRDHALLLFLYNSGARVTEATSLRVSDLDFCTNRIGSAQLRGKGNKTRRCPLWPATCNELLALIRNRSPDDPVFLNRLGQPLSRHGVHWMLRKYIRVAAYSHPALMNRPISPHTIRHTTATHLLRSGVDINTIRAWLGHVSIDTTNIYAEVDLQRKAEVLAHSNAFRTAPFNSKHWRDDLSLMNFLRSL